MALSDAVEWPDDGLVPVVVQEGESRQVLMLAYANRPALEATVASGFAHYWSRSRRKLWKKGETSGNHQRILDIRLDCDGDTLLYRVEQTGPACHTGEPSCFFRRAVEDDWVEERGSESAATS